MDLQLDEATEFVLRALAIGVGATVILDLWSVMLSRLGVTPPNWGMIGRWVGYLPTGRFVHHSIAAAAPIRGEQAIGWTAHYVIGVIYALALLLITGIDWTRRPTLLPALIFGLATVVAPFFILQPGMGAGIAASKAPKPNVARLRALVSHTVFGFGLYAAALATSQLG